MTGVLLAIDTSGGTSVAVLRDGEILAETNHPQGLKHAELIGSALAETLAAAGASAREVRAVAVGRGPALFTGLRVGIAAATMFSAAVDGPLLGVVSHDALALQLMHAEPALHDLPLLVTTDARRGEIYYALYQGLDRHGLPKRVEGPAVSNHDAVLQNLSERSGQHGSLVERTGAATAGWVARLAQLQLRAGVAEHEVSALYLRAPDAVEPKPSGFGKRVSG